ncbi:MAG TPA: helix-turn-helix transcriptional regulator [Kofleriaceae bacterium]|jgi:transcriptional regulator with XRE-family HTH domain|nr:helix-turn-helix transcriptional regulator [Kofleriaceae bacterium]
MDSSVERAVPTIGQIVRSCRAARGKSQLHLALEAGISSRHLSFIETGRSKPSREMVVTLAETLEVPLRERNAWLAAAGYAALYRETPLDAPRMSEVRAAVRYVLDAHGPNPAFAFNRRYDVVMRNDAAAAVVAFFAPAWRGSDNFIELLASPDGLRGSVEGWADVVAYGIDRLKRELSRSSTDGADGADDALLQRLAVVERQLPRSPRAPAIPAPAIVVPMRFHRDGVVLEFFTTITTLGTPLDITLQELRIETFFPATPSTRKVLDAIVAGTDRQLAR